MSAERLAVALWGEDAPPSAVKTVQVYVARLRKALDDPDVLVTTPAGYRLRVRPGELDAERFERQVADGREALAAGRARTRRPRSCARRWSCGAGRRSPSSPRRRSRRPRSRAWRSSTSRPSSCASRPTSPPGATPSWSASSSSSRPQHPWRERLHAQLMLALYRSGRQADALEAYRHAREVLVEQLGIEPGAELHDLHEAILAHDPALDAHPAAPGSDERRPRPPSALGDRRLPAPPNRTIGREHELGAIGERLRTGSVRLLTLTGPGGVGKTRLALEAARAVEADFADGAHFVSLAAVQRPEDVPAAIVSALGIVAARGRVAPSRRSSASSPPSSCCWSSTTASTCWPPRRSSAACSGPVPRVTVLATSREPLALQAEQRYPVPPLALPRDARRPRTEALAGVDAVALFCERARAHDPGVRARATATPPPSRRSAGASTGCRWRSSWRPPAAGCSRPPRSPSAWRRRSARSAPAPRDAPARQQTLRATIDWSHDLLSDDEQACFARFAVFAGGATVEAAETVTGADLDTLDRLVAKSLLVRRRQRSGPRRLAMLETIRAYAAERFAALADREAVRERHYRYFLALAQRHGTDAALWGASATSTSPARRRDRQPPRRARVGGRAGADAGPPLDAVRGARPILADARSLRGRGRLDRPGAEPPGAEPIRRCASARCASRPWPLWPLGRRPSSPRSWPRPRPSPERSADPRPLARCSEPRARSRSRRRPARSSRRALADEALDWAKAAGDEWEIAMAASRESDDGRATSRSCASASTRPPRCWRRSATSTTSRELLPSAAYRRAVPRVATTTRATSPAAPTPLARELDNPYSGCSCSGNLGLAALLTGDTDAARDAFREELELCRELVVRPPPSKASSASPPSPRSATTSTAPRASTAPPPHIATAIPKTASTPGSHATFFEPARTRRGADAWDAAVREGAALSFDDAIAYALTDSRTDTFDSISKPANPG